MILLSRQPQATSIASKIADKVVNWTKNVGTKDRKSSYTSNRYILGVTIDIRLPGTQTKKTFKQRQSKEEKPGWNDLGSQHKNTSVCLYRPIVQHASSSWDTAAKTHLGKLNNVQNKGLRITLRNAKYSY